MKVIEKKKQKPKPRWKKGQDRRINKPRIGRGKFGANVTNTLKYTPDDFKRAIKDSKGIKYTVYQRVGCTWKTLEEYFIMYPELKEQFEQEKQTANTFVNQKMFELIEKGDKQMINLYQQTKGGYIKTEKIDHTTNGETLNPHKKLSKQEMIHFKEVFDDEF